MIVHVVATSPADVAGCANAFERCQASPRWRSASHQATPDDVAQIGGAEANTPLPLLVRVPLYQAVRWRAPPRP